MKKTIKKRAFVSAIAMLIVSAIVLTSSTFAWFTMSKQATIETMNLSVSSPEGIQISANATAWTASLTLDDIFNIDTSDEPGRYDAYDGNRNVWPSDLIPCSTPIAGVNANGDTAFYRASLDESRQARVTQFYPSPTDPSTGLIAFDLFFKVAKQETVMFSASEFLDPAGTDALTALRVAFVNLGNVPISTPASEVVALSSFNSSETKIYEPDSINRSADASASGHTPAVLTTNVLRQASSTPLSVTDDNIILTGTAVPSVNVVSSNNNSNKYFTIQEGVTKMRIYIWMEGQDIDCRNSVAGAAFTAALKFTIY